MLKKIFLICLLAVTTGAGAKTILVTNLQELAKANKEALPGDEIILQNGRWDNVTISLNCSGTADKPIVFKAQTAGKVIITGNSKLMLGGNYIVVDGWYFTDGFAGDDAVIKFRVNKKELANNCRLTNTVINNFNNPKRMDDNYWVMLYGKHNRIDHCSFLNKKNMGVLMAVILDDERSRENFHSVDHNYFGRRLPLASNTGETIRVGVSEHCEFNSNTQITDNFFEHCDGETEIISIKSGSNYIGGNLFKECQGSVVMRHGNYNTVENNVFLGNNKKGTGGVRVINKGQWVVNNLFYKCRGEWFRSPLSVMNGVPNSPANRYVAVTEALIANNSFFECTPIGLGIGSDTERSVPPKDVYFINNLFYNHSDSLVYNAYDDISGISFAGNLASTAIYQPLLPGFKKTRLATTNTAGITIPVAVKLTKPAAFDSLLALGKTRLKKPLAAHTGFTDNRLFVQVENNAKNNSGAPWFTRQQPKKQQRVKQVNCKTAEDIYRQLAENSSGLAINLTGKDYNFSMPLLITQDVVFTSSAKNALTFTFSQNNPLMQVKAGSSLGFKQININLKGVNNFIVTDTSGSSNHSSFSFMNAHFLNLTGAFFTASPSSVADSITVYNCTFTNNQGILFDFTRETTNKGLYNVEILQMKNNRFINCSAPLLNMLRGGNDESTMGPDVVFSNNIITGCNTANKLPLIHLFGTQLSSIRQNRFTNSNPGATAIMFEDLVKAVHIFSGNTFKNSGRFDVNKFVTGVNNTVVK